jgi:diacylglycerol kinase family enzyme
MPDVFHVLNPSAPHRPWVSAMAQSAAGGNPMTWVSREHPEHTETLVDWALKEGVKRLVVWGGDGTFHRVARAVARRGALDRLELALVPVGTCNDLARRQNLSKYFYRRWEAPSPEGKLASLTLGRLAWRSAGGAGEDVFVNNAGFGRPRSSFEAKHGPFGVLKAFVPLRLSASWPEGKLDGLYYMLLACSGPYFSGGLHFEKAISPEDGVLRFYFVPATSKTRLALRLLRGRLGFPLFDGKTTKVTASRLSVRAEPAFWPRADGEPPPAEGAVQVDFETLPQKVRLWRPE